MVDTKVLDMKTKFDFKDLRIFVQNNLFHLKPIGASVDGLRTNANVSSLSLFPFPHHPKDNPDRERRKTVEVGDHAEPQESE